MTRLSVQNYDEMNNIPARHDIEIVVRSSGFVYRFRRDHWEFVARDV